MLRSSFFSLVQDPSLLALLLGVAIAVPAFGQDGPPRDETLFQGVTSSGGYGGPFVAITPINGELRTLVGGQGGWIINRQFVIGGAGRGLATSPNRQFNDRPAELQFGYGGLLLEYIAAPSELVHLGADVLIGGGGVQLMPNDFDPPESESFDENALFVTEGGVRLELNMTNYFRVGLTGGYRLVSGSDLQDVSDTDLGGPYGGLTLRFGSF